MSLKSRTALALVAASMALVPVGSSVARPVSDVGAARAVPRLPALPPVAHPRIAAAIRHPAAISAGPRTSSVGGGGIDTAVVLLLAAAAALAGAALGFWGARLHATRGALHSH